MGDDELVTEGFEANRAHLLAVAFRMLGSSSEADDAVQEAWLRLNRSDTSDVENLGGWLTTVVARVCLDMLRSRASRREEPLGAHAPEPIASHLDRVDPEHEALLADSVGLALLVVLETLSPAERLAFVLHDMFAVPFDEIAAIAGCSSPAARQLARRARRRVQGAPAVPDTDRHRQRQVVAAFLAAPRGGEFDALLELLDPDVVLRADRTAVDAGAAGELIGAAAVAGTFSGRARNPRCTGYDCPRRAARCDLDHDTTWPRGAHLRDQPRATLPPPPRDQNPRPGPDQAASRRLPGPHHDHRADQHHPPRTPTRPRPRRGLRKGLITKPMRPGSEREPRRGCDMGPVDGAISLRRSTGAGRHPGWPTTSLCDRWSKTNGRTQ